MAMASGMCRLVTSIWHLIWHQRHQRDRRQLVAAQLSVSVSISGNVIINLAQPSAAGVAG